MSGGEIRVEDRGGVRFLTLVRPDKANALTADMLARLADHCEAAHELPVLVLTGEGKVFSAGADLEAARAGLATSPDWERLSGAIAAHPGLTIAALNGSCAGGAMGMMLACDLRIAIPEARFFYPVMRLGFLPQPSDPKRLIALVGPARAKMILMGGARIAAEDALGWGLVDRIVPSEHLLETATALAADSCAADTAHLRAIKALCR